MKRRRERRPEQNARMVSYQVGAGRKALPRESIDPGPGDSAQLELNSMKTFDVVIVGGGPAGLECARVLSASGASILLVERRSITRSKTCAGGLLYPCDIELPEERTRIFPRERYRLADHDIEIQTPVGLRTIQRIDLARRQLEQLQGIEGLTILETTSVRAIEPATIATDAG